MCHICSQIAIRLRHATISLSRIFRGLLVVQNRAAWPILLPLTLLARPCFGWLTNAGGDEGSEGSRRVAFTGLDGKSIISPRELLTRSFLPATGTSTAVKARGAHGAACSTPRSSSIAEGCFSAPRLSGRRRKRLLEGDPTSGSAMAWRHRPAARVCGALGMAMQSAVPACSKG